MATLFKNKLAASLGTVETTVLTTSANANTTIVGLSLTNLTAGVILASIRLEDTVNSVTAYFMKEILIPPNQSLRVVNGGERLVLSPSTNIKISSNAAASMDLVLSYVEIV